MDWVLDYAMALRVLRDGDPVHLTRSATEGQLMHCRRLEAWRPPVRLANNPFEDYAATGERLSMMSDARQITASPPLISCSQSQ